MSPKDGIHITLVPLADAVAWPVRVRRLLKYALRVCRLRCVLAEQLLDGPANAQGAAGRIEQGNGTPGPPYGEEGS
jgi:hypothetical protein